MKVGEKFGPHPNLKTLYYSYLLIPSVIIFVVAILPAIVASFLYLLFTRALIVSALLLFSFLLVVGITAFWIQKYYSSISYLFAESEIVVEKGVWWKHKSSVPYNRITNIDIVQGPISRRFGLGKVRVQTAGYSGTGAYGGRVAEASIFGVENFEEIRDFIMSLVRGLRPVAVEAGVEVVAPESSREILAELRKIREILERQTP